MGQVLPDPFNIRVGSRLSLKKPEASSSRVRVIGIPGMNPTRIYNILKKKKKKTLTINTHFSPKCLRPILSPSHSLPSRLPFSPSPSLSLSLKQDRRRRCFASYAHFVGATPHFAGVTATCIPRQRRSILHLAGLFSLPLSPCHSLQTLLLLPHFARPSSTSQGCNFLISKILK